MKAANDSMCLYKPIVTESHCVTHTSPSRLTAKAAMDKTMRRSRLPNVYYTHNTFVHTPPPSRLKRSTIPRKVVSHQFVKSSSHLNSQLPILTLFLFFPLPLTPGLPLPSPTLLPPPKLALSFSFPFPTVLHFLLPSPPSGSARE